MSIGENERATQDRVVSFFKDSNILDYEYLGNLKDVANKNIREDRLRAYLRLSGYSKKLIDGAVMQLVKAADKLSAHIKCLEEQKAGNTEFDTAAKQTWESMKAMERPELDWFLDNCLGAFALNLDQL